MLTRILSSIFPKEIDSDDQLPFIIDNVTDIDAIHINALKDSIIAIEKTLGIMPAQEFSTLKERMLNVENKFVSISGDIMTGDLNVSNSPISRIFFGNNKNTAILWANNNLIETGIYEPSRVSISEELIAVPFIFLGTAADGSSAADIEISNDFINDNDIFGNSSGEVFEPVEHRRIRMFHDVDVQGYWHNRWALVAKNIVISDLERPDVEDEYDSDEFLLQGGALIISGDIEVSGNFDALGSDKVIAWAAENKPAHGMSSASAVSVKLSQATGEAALAEDLNKPYPRVDVVSSAYPVGWGPIVTIPANENIKALFVLFSTVLVGPGRVLLRINSGSELEGPENLDGRIDWPRLENLSLYPYDAKNFNNTPIVTNDIYTVSGQAIIPIGENTRGTVWINEGTNVFPSDQPMVEVDYECSFDPTQDNILSMYYDYGWIDHSGNRWEYFDTDKRVLYSNQQAQMFVYALSEDDYNFKVKRIANEFNWNLLEEFFDYANMDELRASWSVTDDPPNTEVSLGSVKFLNTSNIKVASIDRNIGTIGTEITVSFELRLKDVPEKINDGRFGVEIQGTNNLYALYFCKDGIYMNDKNDGYVLIPDSAQYIEEGLDYARWHVWFEDYGSTKVKVRRVYRNNKLIYSEDDSLMYTSVEGHDEGYIRIIASSVIDPEDFTEVIMPYLKIGSTLFGYGETYGYDTYSPYGY